MTHDHLEPTDRLLDDAFRSVRQTYDGAPGDAPDATLHRALFAMRKKERKRRLTRWVVLPAAAVFFASTAWGGMTGRLVPAIRSAIESIYEGRSESHEEPASSVRAQARSAPAALASASSAVSEPSPPTEPATVVDAPAALAPAPPSPTPVAHSAELPTPMPTSAAPEYTAGPPARVPPSVRTSPPTPPAAAIPPAAAPAAERTATIPPVEALAVAPAAAAPVASVADPHAPLFAEAHRIHFAERDPARAVAAWDRYLREAPTGRFVPEARYNRALALVRLGRTAEARRDLEAFASGVYGTYRRDEAKALLDALERDASR